MQDRDTSAVWNAIRSRATWTAAWTGARWSGATWSGAKDPLSLAWACGAAVLVGLAAFGAWVSPKFGYDHAVIDTPALTLAAGLCAAGFLFALAVPALVRRTQTSAPDLQRAALMVMIAGGLAARLVLLPSEPMLEDDYQRYLWDGAVTASGLNPYAASPRQATRAPLGSHLRSLAADSGVIMERLGHPTLKTIYPPVAQAAFALAYALKPWSLVAWRLVLLACDLTVLGLLIALLGDVGRAPVWAALYWWNPLVIKEVFNSGHMEALVMALVLLAVLLGVRRRPVAAVTALAFAVGAKVWPILLLPLVARPLMQDWRRLAVALAVITGLTALWAWPIWSGGLDETSGFVAYATKWQTNSALFPALERLLAAMAGMLGQAPEWGGRVVRAGLAIGIGGLALWLARHPAEDAADLVRRAAIVSAALVFLSPAQYPWYAIWFLPFLPFLPLRAFLVLTATLPLYYAFFHFNARGHPEIFRGWIVWAIWIPAWMALAMDLRDGWGERVRPGGAARSGSTQAQSA